MKSLKKYYKIGIGAFLLFLGIGRYTLNEFEYSKNIVRMPEVTQVEVFGDSGEPGKSRDIFATHVNNLPFLSILGDELYPNGVQNEQEFIQAIKKPFFNGHNIIFFVGGNHTQYAQSNRDFLLKLARSKKYPWFIYPNYYYGVIAKEMCFVFADTAVYDSIRLKDIKNAQESFISAFIQEDECANKSIYLFAHHGIFASDESHGDRKNDRWKKFYNKIKDKLSAYVNGHSHLTSWEGYDGRLMGYSTEIPIYTEGPTAHVTVGASSKINKCTRNKNIACFERLGWATILPRKIYLNLL